MISRSFKWFLIALGATLIVGVAAAMGLVRADNARLRLRIAQQTARMEQVAALRLENRRTEELLARAAKGGAPAAVAAVREELVRMKTEVAGLEQRALEARRSLVAQARVDREAMDNNRDLSKGLVRVEHLRDVGAATPDAAMQTFIWASVNGHDDVMSKMCLVSASAQEKAEALISNLPEESRRLWSAKKLGLQFFNGVITEIGAAQVVGVTMEDQQHATVELRVHGKTGANPKLPMELGPNGWRLVITDKYIAQVQKRLHLMAERGK